MFEVLAKADEDSEGKENIALPTGKTTTDSVKSIVAVDNDKPATSLDLSDIAPKRFSKVTPGTSAKLDIDARNNFFEEIEKAFVERPVEGPVFPQDHQSAGERMCQSRQARCHPSRVASEPFISIRQTFSRLHGSPLTIRQNSTI